MQEPRLVTTSDVWIFTPVTFPPGLARLSTRPSSTGSSPTKKTIGIVTVAALAACADTLLSVAITATRRRTRAIHHRQHEADAGMAAFGNSTLHFGHGLLKPTQLAKCATSRNCG